MIPRLELLRIDDILQDPKMNSLARSNNGNGSVYGNKEELYDRLRRHAYNGKKGKRINNYI